MGEMNLTVTFDLFQEGRGAGPGGQGSLGVGASTLHPWCRNTRGCLSTGQSQTHTARTHPTYNILNICYLVILSMIVYSCLQLCDH